MGVVKKKKKRGVGGGGGGGGGCLYFYILSISIVGLWPRVCNPNSILQIRTVNLHYLGAFKRIVPLTARLDDMMERTAV